MKKLFSLFFITLFSVSMWAGSETGTEFNKQYLYVCSSNCSWWTDDSSQPALNAYWNDEITNHAAFRGEADDELTSTSWYFDLSTMHPSYLSFRGFKIDRHPKNSSYYWNTVTLAVGSGTHNCLYINSDGKGMTWGYYAAPITSIALAGSNNIISGDGTENNPYRVLVGNAITLTATPTFTPADETMTFCANFGVSPAENPTTEQNSSTYTVNSTDKVELKCVGRNKYGDVYSADVTSTSVWVEGVASYTLTYSIGTIAGTDGSIATDPETASGSKIQDGNSITLTAPAAKAGYTWSGWYTNAAGTEGKIEDNNRAITITMNADKTLYACYTENMSALTVSMDYTSAAASACSELAAPTPAAASIGIATTVELTATEAPAGYKLTWALTHCAITVGNENSAVITVRSDGSGEAASAVANYDEDLSSNWYLVGDDQIFPEGWESDAGSMMLKKTGHSAESNVYMDITVADVKTYLFKITYHTDAITNWYGYSDVDWLEWTATDTKTVYTGSGNGHELKFTPTYAGKYEFKVDYSGAYPAVTITYPAGPPTAIDEAVAGKKAVKRIVNGQLVIEREGKLYNALGAEVK